MTPIAEQRWPVPGPLNLRATLGPLRRGPGDPTVRMDGSGAWRTTWTAAGPATLRLWLDGEALAAQAWGDGGESALAEVPALAGMHDDPARFAPEHPLLKQLQQRFAGMRFGRTGKVMEALIPTVLAQRVTSVNAGRSWRELVWRHAERAPGPQQLWMPPRPEALRALRTPHFARLGVERSRSHPVIAACNVARRMEEAAAMTPEDATARLRAVRGIGPWTAAKVVAVALGDPDTVIVGDYHLPHAVCWALAREPRGDDERMLELLEPYRGHRGRVVRMLTLGGIHAPRYGPKMEVVDIRER